MKLTQAFVLALSSILFASSDLSNANIFIAFIINMIVLTIIADSNDYMGHLNEPPGSEKYQHIWLLSFSLYNKWFNLKRTREISVFNAQGTATVKRVSEGNYSLKRLGQALQDALKSVGVKVEINTPRGVLEIHSPQN